jgi:DNA invertase Pin-like site-specific DNA recombinase
MIVSIGDHARQRLKRPYVRPMSKAQRRPRVERPDYERLLVDIAAGRIGVLIFWPADRFLRSTDEADSFIRLARAHQVRVYSSTKGAQ